MCKEGKTEDFSMYQSIKMIYLEQKHPSIKNMLIPFNYICKK